MLLSLFWLLVLLGYDLEIMVFILFGDDDLEGVWVMLVNLLWVV